MERKRFVFWTITIAAVIVVCELLSAITLAVLYNAAGSDATEGAETFSVSDIFAGKHNTHLNNKNVAHPYLGYVRDTKVTPITDFGRHTLAHHGFGTSKDVFVKDPESNEVVIGIFGGSVAGEMSAKAMDHLLKRLQSSSAFAGKKITHTTAALGGYKQPQQLLAYTYLLSQGAHFDIVINIDGFNEAVLPAQENVPKGVDPFFPRGWYFLAHNLDTDVQTTVAKITLLKDFRSNLAAFFGHAPLRYSKTAEVVRKSIGTVLEKKIGHMQHSLLSVTDTADNFGASGPIREGTNNAQVLFPLLADMWVQSSIHMHQLSLANGAQYFHFLQPNQYVKGSKPMEQKERATALRHEAYDVFVSLGYPLLQKESTRLEEAGVQFTDATGVFSDHTEPLYVDSCCHYSVEGYRILADTIADTIIEYYQ